MEERRDEEHIIEVTADKEQAILRIAEATGIETERIEKCIAELERNGILTEERSIYVDTRGCIQEDIRDYYCPEKLEDKGYYCTTYIEQEIWRRSDRISSVASMPAGSLCQEWLQRQSHGAGTE